MRVTIEGTIRIVAVSLSAGLLLTAVGFAQPSRVKPVQQVTIEDSKGKTVGRALSGGGFQKAVLENPNTIAPFINIRTTVLLQVDENVVPVAVGKDAFYGGFGVWYESENCVGTPWVWVGQNPPPNLADPPSLLPRVAVAPPGQTIYIVVPNAEAKVLTFKSANLLGSCTSASADFEALPTQPLIDLLTVFTPPFRLRTTP